MSSTLVSDPINHGYSVLRVVTDDTRGDTVPVGVVAWDTKSKWFHTRALQPDEKISGVPKWARSFISTALQQLNSWASSARVPYEEGTVPPFTDRFWGAASEIMSTAVRLDPPKAMEPMVDPEAQIEGLFEAIVQPRQPAAQRTERIDGALSRALGELADRIPTREQVAAFGGAQETVLRGLVTHEGVLILEGINLSAARAREGADALVSRVMRILAAYDDKDVSVIIGYTASPGGLNGERHMRDWIQERLTRDVFDLVEEDHAFKDATRTAWERLQANSQGSLHF